MLLSLTFFFSSFLYFSLGVLRRIRIKSQATITSGQAISWTRCACTFQIRSLTGHTPCLAMFTQPGLPTVVSKTLATGSSSEPGYLASRDTPFEKTHFTWSSSPSGMRCVHSFVTHQVSSWDLGQLHGEYHQLSWVARGLIIKSNSWLPTGLPKN